MKILNKIVPCFIFFLVFLAGCRELNEEKSTIEFVERPLIDEAIETDQIFVPAPETQDASVETEVSAENFPGTPEPVQVITLEEIPNTDMVVYTAQSGDTISNLSVRFGVTEAEIIWRLQPQTWPDPDNVKAWDEQLIPPGEILIIPDVLDIVGPADQIMPDSEIIFSTSAEDFNVRVFLESAGGFLADYESENVSGMPIPAHELITKASIENSINPRILLALLEAQCGCVFGPLNTGMNVEFLMGNENVIYRGFYKQLIWAVEQLSAGYYGWRSGNLTELNFPDGGSVRIAPTLNAGTVAVQNFFSKLYSRAQWETQLDKGVGLPAFYAIRFGDPWYRAWEIEPVLPTGLTQPWMTLPFEPGVLWAFTGGPHTSWEKHGPPAALDFAPQTATGGCEVSEEWVISPAAGLVVRVGDGLVVVDLDGDGNESTGWVLIFLHLAKQERVYAGTRLKAGDKIGHPSCEGGRSSAAHLHIARKFNGEWIDAGGPVPFVMDGWVASSGEMDYKGALTKDEVVITADINAAQISYIIRDEQE